MIILFAYAFISNVALALVPHEPVVVWYGAHLGAWNTALVATAGTVLASWVDHRVFVPLITRAGRDRELPRLARALMSLFNRAPFAVIAISGLTPLPFFPFKALAFAARYPLGRYLAAVAVGRLPRYFLLAWLGAVINIPFWALGALFLLLAVPSLRLLGRRRTAPAGQARPRASGGSPGGLPWPP